MAPDLHAKHMHALICCVQVSLCVGNRIPCVSVVEVGKVHCDSHEDFLETWVRYKAIVCCLSPSYVRVAVGKLLVWSVRTQLHVQKR